MSNLNLLTYDDVARKVLRAVVIGHRTIRFRPADVERALAKLAGEERREW